MRTLAVGVESYVVDWNTIVGATGIAADIPGCGQQCGRLIAYSRLTTPVAYLTSQPKAPRALFPDAVQIIAGAQKQLAAGHRGR